MLTWDENKRLLNIANHELDFSGCEAIFDGPTFSYEDKRAAYGEQRICVIGWLNGEVVHLTYTDREENFHAISLRKAVKYEINQFFKEISR